MANEKQLVDVSAAKAFIDANWPNDPLLKRVAFNLLDKLPRVDAVEVVHGRWEPHFETFDADQAVGILGGNYQTGWQCSVCGRYEPSKEPYCNCGAKMDLEG